MWLTIKEKELIEKDEEIKRQIAINKEMDKIIGEKNKEIKELRNRVAELEDKDWYELCIKQLEEQNDKLIKERDELAFEKPLRTQIADLEHQLEIYKQALEIACENFENFIYIRDQEWLTKPECLLAKASKKLKGE